MRRKMIPIVAILFLLCSCRSSTEGRVIAQYAKWQQQSLTFAEMATIQTMDTTQATDGVSLSVMNNVFEGLFRLDQNNEPTDGIAKSYEISEDGLVYTFTIREDAYWSNGTPVTAHDFVFAWQKAIHPETLSPYAYMIAHIKNGERILNKKDSLYGQVHALGAEALNEKTLQVTLERPIPYFLHLTAFPTFFPQNEQFVKELGKEYGKKEDKLIYNGPFVLKNWREEQGWNYAKNETYWDRDAVQLQEVRFVVVKDLTTVLRLYETDKVDRVSLSSEYVDLYRDHPDFRTMEYATVSFIRFNHEKKELQNANIRKAIANGWEKEPIAAVLLNNGTHPAYYIVPKNFVIGPDGKDFRGREQFLHEGIEKAKQYWEKGLKELGIKTLQLELLTYDSENSSIIGQYLKNQLEKNLRGLSIRLKPQPYSQKLALENSLRYDLAFSSWGADYHDPLSFLEIFTSSSGNNHMAYSNKRYDQLIEEANDRFDDFHKRFELLKEAEAVLLNDAAIVPMFQFGSAYLQRSKIKNLINHPYGAGRTFKWAYVDNQIEKEGNRCCLNM